MQLCSASQLMAVPLSTSVDKCRGTEFPFGRKWPFGATKVLESSGLCPKSSTFRDGMELRMLFICGRIRIKYSELTFNGGPSKTGQPLNKGQVSENS